MNLGQLLSSEGNLITIRHKISPDSQTKIQLSPDALRSFQNYKLIKYPDIVTTDEDFDTMFFGFDKATKNLIEVRAIYDCSVKNSKDKPVILHNNSINNWHYNLYGNFRWFIDKIGNFRRDRFLEMPLEDLLPLTSIGESFFVCDLHEMMKNKLLLDINNINFYVFHKFLTKKAEVIWIPFYSKIKLDKKRIGLFDTISNIDIMPLDLECNSYIFNNVTTGLANKLSI